MQGTCVSLEKKYFRLTGPPDPSAVRAPHVLQAALERVVRMYRAGQCDIHYAEDQLKAMRQDVTVQHVRGSLPVQIYEAHARACLEHGNGGDFNQCQTQLKVLYEEGSPGCVEEFVAYRVLYQAILRTKESASLLATLEELTPQVRCLPYLTAAPGAALFCPDACNAFLCLMARACVALYGSPVFSVVEATCWSCLACVYPSSFAATPILFGWLLATCLSALAAACLACWSPLIGKLRLAGTCSPCSSTRIEGSPGPGFLAVSSFLRAVRHCTQPWASSYGHVFQSGPLCSP